MTLGNLLKTLTGGKFYVHIVSGTGCVIYTGTVEDYLYTLSCLDDDDYDAVGEWVVDTLTVVENTLRVDLEDAV